MAIPSKMAWMDKARTMMKLLMAERKLLSLFLESVVSCWGSGSGFGFVSDGVNWMETMLLLRLLA